MWLNTYTSTDKYAQILAVKDTDPKGRAEKFRLPSKNDVSREGCDSALSAKQICLAAFFINPSLFDYRYVQYLCELKIDP
jgi:hypothetical protein